MMTGASTSTDRWNWPTSSADGEIVPFGLYLTDRHVQGAEDARLARVIAAHEQRQAGLQFDLQVVDSLEVPNRDALYEYRCLS